MNEYKRMQELAGILITEITVDNPNRKFLFGIDRNGYFTELVKIESYNDSNEVLTDINKFFNYKEEEGYYDDDGIMKNPKYVYLSGDGQAIFSEDLSNFSEERRTPEEWGVKEWITSKEYNNRYN